MNGPRLVAWARDDGQRGHSLARVAPAPSGWTCDGSEVSAGPDEALACTFRIELDPDWCTVHVEVDAVDGSGRRRLVLTAADGRWTRDGASLPELDGCTDVDVAASPLTNTFPIRRLAALPVGESATLPVAWVDVPALTVSRVDQTYTRLGHRAWRYTDDTHGSFDLSVDDDGLVVDYAGLARRVHP